jgi:hypothetical protein
MLRGFSVGVYAALVAVVLLAGIAAVQAQTRGGPDGFSLTYDVYSGGFRALRLDFTVDIEDRIVSDIAAVEAMSPRYDTRVKMETSGIIGALFNWRFDATSTGAWRDSEIVPVRYRTANVWRGNEREVAIEYENGVARKVSAIPPYSEEDMKKVTPSMRSGAVDPTSAVTSLVLTSAFEGRCRPQTAVYDGRRRYDANMAVLAPRDLKPSAYAPFVGLADGCKLTFKRIAGFKPDRKRLQDFEVDIWLAEVGVEAGRVPVRLELVTPWGKGFAHLVSARKGDGTQVFGAAEPE